MPWKAASTQVLLVDDDAAIWSRPSSRQLQADGRFEVRIAANGFDAGMMVKEYRPDIIVLDVMLPDINGKEVCQRVRADPSLEDVHHLHLRHDRGRRRFRELKLSGADDFLPKPFDVDHLIEKMCANSEIETGVLDLGVSSSVPARAGRPAARRAAPFTIPCGRGPPSTEERSL